MAADGSVIISIDADGKLAIKELEKTGEEIGGLGEKAQNAEKGMTELTAGAAAVTAALVAIGKAAIDAATQFESAFAKTQTIMDETEVSVSSMRESILDLSSLSAMAATDVSDAVYNAISGSVATKDAVGFVDQANKLSVAGFTSLSNATDIMTTTLNAYGLSAEKVGGISNVLIQTQNLGKTTVDELAGSMGRAISTASAYGIDLQNLSTAYVELTRGGIQTRMATTYLSGMFNELGDASSKVGSIIMSETGASFGELMARGWSLGDVLQILSDTVNGNSEAMMGLWGSQEAGKAANAILTQSVEDFNAVLSQMNAEMAGTTGTTESAYATMTSTSEFIDNQLSNSFTNLGIAIGSDLNPALDEIKSGFTKVIERATEFVNEHPQVVAVLTKGAVTLGVVAIAFSGYAIATKIATAATAAFTAVMNMNPIFLAVTAVTALVAGLVAYELVSSSATENTQELTAASKKQQKEINNLKAEYDNVCKAQGETSAAAIELKDKIDKATESFEESKQTVAEFREEYEKLIQEFEQKRDAYDDSIQSLDAEYEGTSNLIERLNELTSAEEQSAAAKEEIASIVDILNGKYPDLALTYDKLTGILNMSPEDISAAALSDYRSKWNAENYNELGSLEYELPNLIEANDKAKKAKAEAYKNLEDFRSAWHYQGGERGVMYKGESFFSAEEKMSVDKYQSMLESFENEYNDAFSDFEKTSTAYSEAVAKRQEILGEFSDMYQEQSDYAESTEGKIDSIKETLAEFGKAYEEAYIAARESMQGQYALWDDVAKVSAKSVEDVTASQRKQAEYWTSYKDNIDTLLEYSGRINGLSEMVASFGDGSADSVDMIAGMAESLTSGDTSALETLVSAWQENQEAIDAASSSLGDLQSGLSDGVAEIAEGLIDELDLGSEAETAAADTINSYAQAIRDTQTEAVTAASEVAAAVKAALGTTITVSVVAKPGGTIPKNATGTINAERGIHLVGEHGPELVYMSGGERVITADETRRMLTDAYPVAPDMHVMDNGIPVAGRNVTAQISAVIAVPLSIDGREFARATAEYIGEEMEFEVM